MEGQYIINVQFAGREIPKSPYVVNIEGMAGDPSKVVVEGAGVGDSGKIPVNKMTSFHVHTTSQLSLCLSVCVCVSLCVSLCLCLSVCLSDKLRFAQMRL